jgi:Protein of unknown function (DUF2511)
VSSSWPLLPVLSWASPWSPPYGQSNRVEIKQTEYGDRWPFRTPQGWLRCEGAGAIILTVQGRDYAVNGMAGSRYGPMQAVWDPSMDLGPIVSRFDIVGRVERKGSSEICRLVTRKNTARYVLVLPPATASQQSLRTCPLKRIEGWVCRNWAIFGQ